MARPKKNKKSKSVDAPHTASLSNQSSSISSTLKPKIHQQNLPKGFKFISNTYSVHLECPLCQQLMIRPMRAHPCGHTFCQKCIQPFEEQDKKNCPFNNCLRKFQRTQNDRTAENLIDELKVQCTNEPCVYKGVFEHYKKHHKDTCAFRNGGIDTWLGNLTQGLVLTKRASQLTQNNDNEELSHPIQKLEKIVDPIEEYNNEDSQQICNGENEQKQEKGGKQEKGFFEKEEQKKQQKKQKCGRQSKENVEEKSSSNGLLINNSVSSDSGMDLNFSIFNIPFGPSIREQINSQGSRDHFLQKEIKKLQG